MKIIEIRDGFIKFEADKSVYLSSFIQVEGKDKRYVAQITKINVFGELSVATAKILFLYDGEKLLNYDNSEPPKDSEIKPFTYDILENSITAESPIIIGKTGDNKYNIAIDSSVFNKKILLSVDNKVTNNILVRNLVKQFKNIKKNVVIIDTLGIIQTKKYKAGVDFKLPLNRSSLSFLYESCLNDATSDSKALITEIFKDLADYSETVDFMPFSTLKNIIDDMVDKEHNFKLLVLKNKLTKFAKLGCFASKKDEATKINEILNQELSIIDLSELDNVFMNRYLEIIINAVSSLDNTQVFLEASNVISKKNLKLILGKKISSTIITHSKFKYINDIKNKFDNFIIEPSLTNNELFSLYSGFLRNMKKQTYLTVGEATNYMPLVSNLQKIDDVIELPEVDSGSEKQIEITEVENPITEVSNEIVPVKENYEPACVEEYPPALNESDDTIHQEEENAIKEESQLEQEAPIVPEKELESEHKTELEPELVTELESDLESEIDTNTVTELENEIETDKEETQELESSFDESPVILESVEEELVGEQQEEFEEEPLPQKTQEELIASIDEKSDEAIEKVTQELHQPQELGLFGDETENNKNNDTIEDNLNNSIEESSNIITEDDLVESDENNLQDEEIDIKSNEFDDENIQEFSDLESSEDFDEIISKEEEIPANIEQIDISGDETITGNSNNLECENFDSDTVEEFSQDTNDLELEEVVNENDINDDLVLDEIESNSEETVEELDLIDDSEIEDDNIINSSEEPVSDDEIQEEGETFIELEESDLDIDIEPENEADEDLESEKQKLAQLEADFSDPQILPINNNSNKNDDFEEIVELDPSDVGDDEIVVDISEEENSSVDDDMEQKIMDEVDKVYTTLKEDKTDENNEDFSDSDLDLIDELNSGEEQLAELDGDLEDLSEGDDSLLEEQPSKESLDAFNSDILEKRDSSTPIVPVYDAEIPKEDIVMSDPIQQGDNVVHAKYGNGVVEKMIKYGNKSLFSINFDNVGRRLLDPTLTEIKKLQ